MATLQFTINVDGLSDESLVVTGYQGQDNLSSVVKKDGSWCHGFHYHIELASRRPDLTPFMVVDKTAELVMFRDGEVVQRVHGIVRSFTQGKTGHHHTFYRLTLVPEIERLSLRHNSRIFQLMSATDIIEQLLLEMDIQHFSFSLMCTPEKREFCMQYRETDLEFINRLMAEEGIIYHIEHSAGRHTVVFSDNSQTITKLNQPIPYNALSGGVSDTPYINVFSKTTQFEVSESITGDSSFKRPHYSFSQSQMGTDMDYQRQDSYIHYDSPGRFKDDNLGKVFNQYRIESLRRNAHTAQGTSDEPALRSGVKFDMQEHTEPSFNRDWLIIASTHQGKQAAALQEEAGSEPTTYANQFRAIPADKNWRMPQITKPRVEGPMRAYVVGPDSEQIFCDEFGRIRIQFPWDREAKDNTLNEHSSCWVQVSQGWAGSQYGMVALPRVGHEVIVSFLDGDPDQPIVTGRAFNAKNMPPYSLPDNKTKTVWRSKSHQGEGFNEISFEDQAGLEQVYLHAQKDFKADVQNDHITQVNHDQHSTVENDQFTLIKQHHNLTVDGESRIHVKGQMTQQVDTSLQQKISNSLIVDAGQEISISSGGKVVIEAGAELTLKVGGNFIKIDAAGVHLVGGAVNVNSGGSAGSASPYSGQLPNLPNGIEPIQPPPLPVPVDVSSVVEADAVNAASVKPCPLKGDA
ncbi:type VI secretion system Vgr family protein [Vibrio algivorus]|uniref:Type VI secretion system tip protein VgrG n=1 Tax=Vibrio algivorus TaxID=1667024 RepID=A0A557NTM5_9VIBR|nr:type VI secretion system tip protein TssI/VgrG [Vibrio algivorus]TVO31782.1 type VI secretion system tip protein VgrG [Vibrio algivorus]